MNVLIVGAGFGGLSAAITIAKNSDHHVTVVEKRKHVGSIHGSSGGIANHWVLYHKIPERCVLSDVYSFTLMSAGGFTYTYTHPSAIGKIINPQSFLQTLADEADKLGAYFELGRPWNGGFSGYDVIIGADGFNSRVAKSVGLNVDTPAVDTHIGVQYFIETERLKPNNITLFLSRSEIPLGYAWIFPTGERVFEIGCGVPVSVGYPLFYLHKFLDRLGVSGRIFRTTGGLIPTARPISEIYARIGNKHVLLVGDACNHVDPLTGAGIHIALTEGYLAAKSILEGRPASYPGYARPIIRRNRLRYKLKRALYRMTDRDLDSLLKGLGGFRPKSLNPEKELPRLLLRVLSRSPTLIPKLATALLA